MSNLIRIEQLEPYYRDAQINAIVKYKSQVRTFKKKETEEQVPYIHFEFDDGSYIRATAFGNIAYNLFDKVKTDEKYFITNFRVRKSKMDTGPYHELILNKDTIFALDN